MGHSHRLLACWEGCLGLSTDFGCAAPWVLAGILTGYDKIMGILVLAELGSA